MRERQAVFAVVTLLFFSVIFSSESFAEIPQCNGLYATIVGTEDRDNIRGTSGDDVIVGLGGNDIIYGRGGNDVICGGEGNDKLYGNSGNDILLGEKDNNRLNGGKGFDTCDASSYDKKVSGCEVPYNEPNESNVGGDLQKQIEDMQNQLNNIILGLISWTDIQGIPESLADGDDDMLSSIKCDTEQMLVFDGNSWICNDVLVDTQSNTGCNGNLVNFAGLSHGARLNQIQEKLGPLGITLTATGNGEKSMDTVIIYDSNIDDGKDSDLEVSIGNLAIIPDKSTKPSDSADGGQQVYVLNPPRAIHSFDIVDIESDEEGTAKVFDSNGKVIGSLDLPVTGDKSYRTVTMDYPLVSKLIIDYGSSGGVTNLCISDDEEVPLELECEEDQILVYDGTNWVCGDNVGQNTDTLASLNCEIEQIAKWNGVEWQCENYKKESIPMSFHVSTVGVGRTEWVGTATTVFSENESQKPEIIITTAGVIKNLIAKTTLPMELTPPEPESYSITLLKNGLDTTLTCVITNGMEMCENLESEIDVDIGDTIILKVEASQSAPFAIIRSSVLFSS